MPLPGVSGDLVLDLALVGAGHGLIVASADLNAARR